MYGSWMRAEEEDRAREIARGVVVRLGRGAIGGVFRSLTPGGMTEESFRKVLADRGTQPIPPPAEGRLLPMRVRRNPWTSHPTFVIDVPLWTGGDGNPQIELCLVVELHTAAPAVTLLGTRVS